MSYTRVQVRTELARRHPDLGRNFTALSGGTGAISANEFVGVQNLDLIVPGAVVYINKDAAGTSALPEGEVSWVLTPPSTASGAQLTMAAITAVGAGDLGEVWHRDLQHIDRVNECIDRALTDRCHRWVLVPVTLLLDGDMEKTGVADWTKASTETATKVGGVVLDPVRQSFHLSGTTTTDHYYQSFSVRPTDQFSLIALVKSLTDTLACKIGAYDVTNASDITLSGDGGTAETGAAWQVLRNTFTVPAGCVQIRTKLFTNGAAVLGAKYGWVALQRLNQHEVVLPDRVNEAGKVGRVFRAIRRVSEPHEPPMSWDLEEVLNVEKLAVRGTGGVTLRFPSTLGSDLWLYEEWQGYEALTETVPATSTSRNQAAANDDANTTNADLDWVVEAAALECYLLAYNTWRAGNATRVATPGMPTSDPNPWRFQLMQQAAKVYQLNKNMVGEPQMKAWR